MASTDFKPEFGYVLGVAVAAVVAHHGYMATGVMKARKKFGVKYPNLYANKDNCASEDFIQRFNCVQRAHQNCLENLPTFYTLLTLAGLKYPITAAAAGAVHLAGKIAYFEGYSSGNPEARMRGSFGYLGTFTLLGTVVKFAYDCFANRS